MNEQAIKKLRKKFIKMQTLTLLSVMFLMSGLIYFSNSIITINNIHETTNFITSNDGIIQDAKVIYDSQKGIDLTDNSEFSNKADPYNIGTFLQEIFGIKEFDLELEKYSFATRYFFVEFDENGEMTKIIKNHIAELSSEDAEELGRFAINAVFSFGQYGDYYYQCQYKDDGSSTVIFLESTEKIHQNNRLMFTSLTLMTIGLIITWLVVRAVSLKAIAPEIRAAELQKRFITDASHELKTPLAVIKANTEMEEIINGEDEWTQSTLRQVDRMNGLIKDLVTITKSQEREKSELSDVDISNVVKEVIDTFTSVAKRDEKDLINNVDENIHMLCSSEDIRQLTVLLIDNAIKYCDDKGNVTVGLSQKSRKVTLKISNNYKNGENVDYDKFFERFYREDKSRNIDKGGYGIGLSIAQKIVKNYKGTINVSWENGVISFICVFKV